MTPALWFLAGVAFTIAAWATWLTITDLLPRRTSHTPGRHTAVIDNAAPTRGVHRNPTG